MSNHIDTTVQLETYVDPYPGKDDSETVFHSCSRCGGSGYTVFQHIDNGICFDCEGKGGGSTTVKDERRKEKARVTRRNNEEKKLAKRRQFHNEQMAKAEEQYPILSGWGAAISDNAFLSDIWVKAFDYELSEKQIAAAARVLQAEADRDAARAAEKAELVPVIEGKQTITGEILSVKYQYNDFGGAWKMLVKDDRKFKVWGTVPASVLNTFPGETEELPGSRVTFTGTVSASNDDPTFGFFSRPSKASLLTK